MKDLLVLVPDVQMLSTVEAILNRSQSLGTTRIEFDANVHPKRDPGCFTEGVRFISQLVHEYRYALLMFDAAWEGAPTGRQSCLSTPLLPR